MKKNRRVNAKLASAMDGVSSSGRSSAQVSFATGRPKDPFFYWKHNNLPWDIEKPEELKKLRAMCRLLYLTHPVIGSCVDIYTKFPLVGMEVHCFSGDTEIITYDGTKKIGDLVGTSPKLLSRQGRWIESEIKSFGIQRLIKVTLQRNRRIKEVYTTAGHRWFVERKQGVGRRAAGERNTQSKITWDQAEIRTKYAMGGITQQELGSQYGITQPAVGQIVRGGTWKIDLKEQLPVDRSPYITEVVTSDLVPGDRLISVWTRSLIRDTNPSPFGIAHGATVGDGSLAGSGGGAFIDLNGAKDAALLKFFQGCRVYDLGIEDGHNVPRVRVTNLPGFFKRLPDINESTSYLYGFLAGWFAADGTVSGDGNEAYLDCVNKKHLEFARTICQRFGIKTYGIYEINSESYLPGGHLYIGPTYRLPFDVNSLTEPFFCIENHRIRWLHRTKQGLRDQWKVVAVRNTNRYEEVYCATVPGTKCFALEDNILTGNCKDTAIQEFYTDLFLGDEQLNYEEFLVDVGREYWTVGESLAFGSFNDLLGVWENDELLNPDDVEVIRSPFSKKPRFEMRLPEILREIIEKREPKWEFDKLMRDYPELKNFLGYEARMPVSNVLLKQLKFKLHTFHPRGIPLLMRAIRTITQEEMLSSAMDAIADRLYTPLILAKLGASASDLGTNRPWVPTDDDLADFEEALDAALAGDFRMLVYHFAVQMESVLGREAVPNLDADFDRLTERTLQVFGLSKTMLSGAEGGQTYAADALNRDLVSQLLIQYQKTIKRFFKERAAVVAEAQEHYDYEERGGKRYPIMEEVLEVDEETGEQRIVEQPKLLIPELKIRAMNLKDEDTFHAFLEELRSAGVPISMKTRLLNVPIDLDEEIERTKEEQIEAAVQAQQVRKDLYLRLREEGLPISQDLRDDFEPKAQTGQEPTASQEQPLPSLGMDEPGSTMALAPTQEDYMGADETGDGTLDPSMTNGQVNGQVNDPSVVQLPRNRIMQRPPESDEMRAGMPRASSLEDDPEKALQGIHGPRHVGMRRYAGIDPSVPLDEQVGV